MADRRGATLLLLAWLLCAPAAGMESWQEDLQLQTQSEISDKVVALDAPYKTRRRFVREVVELARQADSKRRRLIYEQLWASFARNNPQLQRGVVEVFARLADPTTLEALIKEMIYTRHRVVRRAILLHLPMYCVPDAQDREVVRQIVEQEIYEMPRRYLPLVRKPPLRAGSEAYDPAADRLRQLVETAIAGQLDPVEAVIDGLETREQGRAEAALAQLCGVVLGRSREDWRQSWRGRFPTFTSPRQTEIDEAQLLACQLLDDMGAEGTTYLCVRLRRLATVEREEVTRGALDAAAGLTRTALRERRHQAAALKKAETAPRKMEESERSWRLRRLAAGERLRELAGELGRKYLDEEDPAVRASAYGCLGATRETEYVALIREALRRRNETSRMLAQVATVLGEIGGLEAVKILALQADYRDVAATPRRQADEYARVKAAMAALARIALDVEADGFKVELSVRDTAVGKEALQRLCAHLGDARTISGAPRLPTGERMTVRELARWQLRQTFHTRTAWFGQVLAAAGMRFQDNSFEAARWLDVYEAVLKARVRPEAPLEQP